MEKTFFQINGLGISLALPKEKRFREVEEIWDPWVVKRPKTRVSIEVIVRTVKDLSRFHRQYHRLLARHLRLMWPHRSFGTIGSRRGRLIARIFSEKEMGPISLYYAVVEPVIHYLMRRLDFHLMHGAGIARGGRAVVILGKSGAGKSTTSALFLLKGFVPLSDDDIILCSGNRGIEALGGEKGIFVNETTLKRFPGLMPLRNGESRPKRGGVKRLLVPPGLRSRPANPLYGRIRTVIFPAVDPKRRSRLTRLNPGQALVQFLDERPNVWPDYLEDPETAAKRLALYHTLSRQADCYRLVLGKNDSAIQALIARLADAG